jgi:hypothetical protein
MVQWHYSYTWVEGNKDGGKSREGIADRARIEMIKKTRGGKWKDGSTKSWMRISKRNLEVTVKKRRVLQLNYLWEGCGEDLERRRVKRKEELSYVLA